MNYCELFHAERKRAIVYGYSGESSPVCVRSIDLLVSVDGILVLRRDDNVYYSPNKTHLVSQSVATEQGFQVAYDYSTHEDAWSMNVEVAVNINV